MLPEVESKNEDEKQMLNQDDPTHPSFKIIAGFADKSKDCFDLFYLLFFGIENAIARGMPPVSLCYCCCFYLACTLHQHDLCQISWHENRFGMDIAIADRMPSEQLNDYKQLRFGMMIAIARGMPDK